MRRTSKGFLLLDSLITVFITSLLCILCYEMHQTILNYEDGYLIYQQESNNNFVEILSDLNNCESCEVEDESD